VSVVPRLSSTEDVIPREVQAVETPEIGADEFWSFVKKAKSASGRTCELEIVG